VLDISSSTPFTSLTIRALNNERDEPLMTAFPVADMNQPAPSPVFFPQIASGGGYTTEFILINPGTAASATLELFNESGSPMEE